MIPSPYSYCINFYRLDLHLRTSDHIHVLLGKFVSVKLLEILDALHPFLLACLAQVLGRALILLLPRTAATRALFISRGLSGSTARYATPARWPCLRLAPDIISPNWIGGSLPLSRHHSSPLRCVLKNASCSFRRIVHHRSLSPSVLLPFAFGSEPWLFRRPHGIEFTLLIVIVKLRARVWQTLMHALHGGWTTRGTTALDFGPVLAHTV
ncbi:hypothetical protein BC826DRAFT_1018295 [Russula brevipes]|nr:hypothetical protein BC826DRAFT_1018295 [Russula brevipes]